MKSLLRLACLAAPLPLPAFAAEPTSVNVYRELVRHRVADVGVDRALDYNTRAFASRLLKDPDSPYSDLREDPPLTNEVWWLDFVGSLPLDTADKSATVLNMLQWQGGFTKARVNVEAHVDDASLIVFKGPYVAANAVKAGIDADIFWKARDFNGAMSTVAAGYAVALQLLRDEIRNHPPEEYEARGIKPDVLKRYLAQKYVDQLGEDDDRYIADIMRYAISKRDFSIDAEGRRQLPTAYRIARVAAAYSDARGYLNTSGYCQGNEPRSREPRSAEDIEKNRPLCFVAATDRAVHSWYRRQMREEAKGVRRAHQPTDWASVRLSFLINTVLFLGDLAPFFEFGEAAAIEELVGEGALAEDEAALAEERVNQLTCRIRP
ncbi:hypothetical protein C8J98_101425 [Luteibacter sp. OK325]|uniref:hypothetical protein n=1 Tax=Luteibacter sp. OK325 TaxID=2135670 RepID=UPI000D37C0B2|nr:hypothetical protein [Luteibacter sp. OK325]PTR35162.1 hypothetical protein C8J98_101425 [Luteibacter sp. OK325]